VTQPQEKPHEPDGFPMAVAVEGAIALVAMFLAWLFGVPLRDQMPDSRATLAAAVARGFVATAPMLAIFLCLVHSERPALRELREQVDRLIRQMFPSASIGQVALVAALAGAGEELLFRGVLQTVLGWWITPVAALVIASLLFGLAHALSKVYFTLATVIGFFLGWLTWYFNDLLAPMVAHGLYDFIALVYLSRQRGTREFEER
jgi:membrane protease YdiL (CAAX protease family)